MLLELRMQLFWKEKMNNGIYQGVFSRRHYLYPGANIDGSYDITAGKDHGTLSYCRCYSWGTGDIKESKRLEDVVRPSHCLVLDSVYGKE